MGVGGGGELFSLSQPKLWVHLSEELGFQKNYNYAILHRKVVLGGFYTDGHT